MVWNWRAVLDWSLYTYRSFAGSSNLLWGLGQQNSYLVGLTKIFCSDWPSLLVSSNQKMMRVEATKFLVNTTKFLVGATKFGSADQKFCNDGQKFGNPNQKFRNINQKFGCLNPHHFLIGLTNEKEKLLMTFKCWAR